jgi:hypothetical protein
VSDMGVMEEGKEKDGKEHNDSFEKYYNKDLDLDEGKTRLLSFLNDQSQLLTHLYYVNRLGPSCNIRAERKCHQLHLAGEL